MADPLTLNGEALTLNPPRPASDLAHLQASLRRYCFYDATPAMTVPMNEPLTVLITGATSGIGRATALHLAAQGHRVFATGRTERDLAQLYGSAPGAKVEPVVLDVTLSASVERAREDVERATGGRGIDVLINNAGFGVGGPAELVTDADLRAQFDVNVFGLMAVTRAFVPAMRRRGAGRVINVSSLASRFTFPLMGTYSATKFAVRSLTDALRQELEPFGVRVVMVEPGVVKTPFITRTMDEAAKYRRADSPYAAAIAHADALKADSERTAVEPELIARLIAKAVTARRPRARYAGPWFARLGVALLNLLPTFAQDALMARLSGLHALQRPRLAAVNALPEAHHG